MNIKQAFAARLIVALDHAGVEQTKAARKKYLAALVGVTPRHAGNYINGEKMPEPEGMIELAEKLRVNPNWLIAGMGPMIPLSEAEIAHIMNVRNLAPADQQKVFRVSEVFQPYAQDPDSRAS